MICQALDCEHYGCKLRRKSLSVSPRVGASTQTRNWEPSYASPPSHYRKPLTTKVPGGFELPVMRMDGTMIRHREAQRDHHKIQDQLAQTQAWAAQQ